jgi:glyoxylase-like metal-dependent hydrolase (beta-lactamase superfamily II)
MQEIAPKVHIETAITGVTLGVITWPHMQVLIDTPFQQEDIRTWRTTLHNLHPRGERMVVCLDDHMDRTIGSRSFDCVVVGHDRLAQLFKDRPVTFKSQGNDTGSEWEANNLTGSTRWYVPEITFSDRMDLNWDDHVLVLEHRPGSSAAAIWATLPAEKVIFLGDAVITNAPPFLATANITDWMESLKTLLKSEYKEYTLVSGRNGVISQNDIKEQVKVLEKIDKQMEKLSGKSVLSNDVDKAAQGLLKHMKVPRDREQQHFNRLRWGIIQYLRHQYGVTLEPSA